MSRAIILRLARQTVDWTWSDRLAWVVPAYALAAIALVPLASGLSLGASTRAAWDTGLTLQWLVVCACGGWLGLRAVGLDLHRRTAAIVLSGPVTPTTWLIGRAVGAAAVLGAIVVSLQLVWLLLCAWRGLEPTAALLPWAVALWLEGGIVGALVALISTRANALVAVSAACGIWIAGHLSGEYAALMQSWGMGGVAWALYAVVPDLDLLDFHTTIVQGGTLQPASVAVAFAYALVWLLALCALTVASTRTRDLG